MKGVYIKNRMASGCLDDSQRLTSEYTLAIYRYSLIVVGVAKVSWMKKNTTKHHA